jgi:hypothetical protein
MDFYGFGMKIITSLTWKEIGFFKKMIYFSSFLPFLAQHPTS